MLFGASYYHEYQPQERLEQDLDMMVQAGFTMIRVGESTWSSYEPEEGQIDFSALLRVVTAASERGLKVIVGTPTYAIPPWMAKAHPEVMARDRHGRTLFYGARQNVDFTQPAFRFYAQRIITAMAAAFAPIPGVIGFQVDNENGVVSLANPQVIDRFRAWAAEHLGGVDGVNEKWGLTYWSQRITDPSQLWGPEANTNPGFALEWERFQRSLSLEFLTWQRDLLRPLIRPEQFVIHDQISGYSAGSTAVLDIANALDRSAINLYVPYQDALRLPEPSPSEIAGLAPGWGGSNGDAGLWAALWRADMAWAMRGPQGSPFSIMEAQATSINGSEKNIPPFPGQLRLFAHTVMSRGADLVAYWHWHTLHYGAETYWGGVLGHDQRPNRVLREVTELGAELKALPASLEGLVPDADLGILYSPDSMKALEAMPALCHRGTSTSDRQTYHRVLSRFYQAATDSGAQVRIVHEGSDWSQLQVLIVPALYIADNALLLRLRDFARHGGHLVLTFRSGYADQWARARWSPQPAGLVDDLGAGYQEYTSIADLVPLTAGPAWTNAAPGVQPGTGEGWADLLTVAPDGGTEVLLGYDHPFLTGSAAVASRATGRGRITWVGTLPDRETSGELVRWALRERGLVQANAAWDRPASARVASASLRDGGRAWFVANHDWAPISLHVPTDLVLRDAVTDDLVHDTIDLAGWDSRILLEDSTGSQR